MRWDDLFADLEGRLAAQHAAELVGSVAERTRAERAGVELAGRLLAHRGAVEVVLRRGDVVAGEVTDASPAWVLLGDGPREHLVPLDAIALVSGLGDLTAGDAGPVLNRLGLGHALRGIAQDRSVVRAQAAGVTVVGRIDAVGADHLDLAEAAPDTHRPTGRRRALAFAALDVLTRG